MRIIKVKSDLGELKVGSVITHYNNVPAIITCLKINPLSGEINYRYKDYSRLFKHDANIKNIKSVTP